MARSLYVTLVLIWLVFGLAAAARAEESAKGWVPFVAKWVQKIDQQAVGVPSTTVISGIFVRNKEGSWFKRATIKSRLPVLGGADTASLLDWVNHKSYFINFTNKTIKPLQLKIDAEPQSGENSTSAQAFKQRHSQDKFLGKRTISGVECEGYALHDSRHKGKFVSEAWYAPSLNYMEVESRGRDQMGEMVTTQIEEIQVGKEPDPQYFRLPEGFKLVK
jgi:hypothetical protein